FNLNLMLGTSTDDTRTWSNYRMAWNFEIPNFYAFDNATNDNRDFSSARHQKRLVGVFGEFRADWKNMIFLTVSGRNDWTSTLPVENRSYLYPSVSGSFVFTELLPKTDWLSFGKIRASWARVGKDTDPYSLDTALWPSQKFLGNRTGVSNFWMSGNATLKPEITEATEIGIELRFFNNRLKVDYAYYTNNSYDQIMSPRLSNATGYILRKVNAGDIYNKGMELSIGGTPIQTKDWTWESTLNVSGNRGTVKNLLEGVEILYVTDVQVGNAKAASFPNGNFMAISGSQWKRDDQGRVILDKNGLPTKATGTNSTNVEIGNREPKFSGGWNNTISYKGLSLNMLWEFRVGGHVYNGTEYAMTLAGISELSAQREKIEVSGVNGSGEFVTNVFEADKIYIYNGKEASGRTIIANYYQDIYPYETANFMTKVNALRLRTVSLSYSLPKSLLAKTNVIKRASVTATANNLLLFTNYNGDPEVAAAGSGAVGSSSVGIDYCGVPSTASFSLGFNLTF
ncbi:TonB-dependent receptor domain-containing protein, partial [Bacteroides heparinolyticus]